MVQETVSLFKIAFLHKYPYFSKGDIHNSMFVMSDLCSYCDFLLAKHKTGDRSACFADFVFKIPFWAHFLIWSIVATISYLYLLRVIKSFLIGLHYKNNLLEFSKEDKK
jgi:uncharacterized protein (DUF983 family)